ncbi:MAG TPA: hypothetical protein QGH10_23690 [Armatimonadota bacterium]|jgi:hypothetical protein|nr:hypothetical protein [Armatimonadota bacterium]
MREYWQHALDADARAVFWYSYGADAEGWDSIRITPEHYASVKRTVRALADAVGQESGTSRRMRAPRDRSEAQFPLATRQSIREGMRDEAWNSDAISLRPMAAQHYRASEAAPWAYWQSTEETP